jgi:hypothetical protein
MSRVLQTHIQTTDSKLLKEDIIVKYVIISFRKEIHFIDLKKHKHQNLPLTREHVQAKEEL